MEIQTRLFGQLFTKFRLKAEFLTLAEFGKALAEEGLLYEDSIFSRWQKGNRIPRDRRVLLTIIKVFIKRKGIYTVSDANLLLESAMQGYLTASEEKELFRGQTSLSWQHEPNSILPPVSPVKNKGEDFNTTLSTIIQSSGKLYALNREVDLLFDPINEGYASLVYERSRKLEALIRLLKLDTTQEGKNLISRIGWSRFRSYSEMYSRVSEYDKAIQEADMSIAYAKDNKTTDLGELYFLKSSLERKSYLVKSKEANIKNKLLEGLSEAQFAAQAIPKSDIKTRIIAFLEVAFYSLALRDKEMFEKEIFEALSLAEELPVDLRHINALIWDAKARGSIRFGLKTDAALDNVKIAKSYSQPRYQNINLNIQSTELQALDASQNPEHTRYAQKLRDIVTMETTILENPYQRMRFEKKKFLGL